MGRDLTSPDRSSVALRRDAAMDAARKYAHESRSASTWRTYESAWRIFAAWCDSVALMALPAEPNTVAMFIGAQAELGLAESTLAHRLAAIRLMHLGQGLPSPHNTLAVMEVMRGLRRHRARAGREPEKKAPIVDEIVKRLVDCLDVQTRRGVRDRALLLYGFAGALLWRDNLDGTSATIWMGRSASRRAEHERRDGDVQAPPPSDCRAASISRAAAVRP